ncbi:hypothetical protein HXXDennis_59 [Xanthomonas phage HXX_Dennis]|nr:hypothetical protein HXXDennis_59 [Xanthomonas phage HXX_Dennis]
MMGDAKPTYTKNRHEFLQLVNAAGSVGCRARGAAFGAACTAMRQLGWVEQVPAIGIKVRITDLGTRALQAWDAGQRGELDLRTGEERRQQILEDVLDLAEQHQLDERLLRALLQRMPLLEVQRCIRGAVQAASAAVATCRPMGPAELQETLETFDRLAGGAGVILPADDDDTGMVVLDANGRVLEVIEDATQRHTGGMVTLSPEALAEPVLTRGEAILPVSHPLVQKMLATPVPENVESKTITVTVNPEPTAARIARAELQEGGLANLLGGARSFVPGGYTGDRPAGPAVVAEDPPAAEEDEDDHGLVICPSCDGRGVTGPAHIDCRMCKGEGAIKRTVPL